MKAKQLCVFVVGCLILQIASSTPYAAEDVKITPSVLIIDAAGKIRNPTAVFPMPSEGIAMYATH